MSLATERLQPFQIRPFNHVRNLFKRLSRHGTRKPTEAGISPEENLPIIERKVSRVFALQIRQPDDILQSMMPTVEELCQAYDQHREQYSFSDHSLVKKGKKILPQRMLYNRFHPKISPLTQSAWIEKGEDSSHKHELILTGGPQKETAYGTLETPSETAIREIAEEIHAYGVESDQIHIMSVSRKIAFDQEKNGQHRRIVHDETYFWTEVPPFLKLDIYDPEDKAATLHYLSSHDLDILFQNGYLPERNGQTAPSILLDSWSNPEDERRIQKNIESISGDIDTEIEDLKDSVARRAYNFEVAIRHELIEKLLLTSSHSNLDKQREAWQEKMRQVSTCDFTNKEQAEQFFIVFQEFLAAFEQGYLVRDVTIDNDISTELEARFNEFTNSGVKREIKDSLKIRMVQHCMLLTELRRAIQLISFEHGLPFIYGTKGQEPFVLGQMIINLGMLTSNEISQIFPAVASHVKLDLIAENNERKDGQIMKILHLYGIACNIFGIRMNDPEWYDQLRTNLQQFRKLEEKVALNKATPAEKASLDKTVYQFEMLFAHAFGMPKDDIFRHSNDVYSFLDYIDDAFEVIADKNLRSRLMSSALGVGATHLLGLFVQALDDTLDANTRWSHLRHILLMLQGYETEQLEAEAYNIGIEPFNIVSNQLATFTGEVMDLTPEGDISLPRYKTINLVETIQTKVGETTYQADISTIPSFIYLGIRPVKDRNSLRRKALERSRDISDFFGKIIILDSEDFREKLAKSYPDYDPTVIDKLTQEWQREFTRQMIAFYQERLDGYYVERVRESNLFQGILESLGLQSKPYFGSAAAQPHWKWLKFVHVFKKHKEELQIFASIKAAVEKLRHKEYNLARLFLPHKQKYKKSIPEAKKSFGYKLGYPIILVLFGTDEGYAELVRSQRQVLSSIKRSFSQGETIFQAT